MRYFFSFFFFKNLMEENMSLTVIAKKNEFFLDQILLGYTSSVWKVDRGQPLPLMDSVPLALSSWHEKFLETLKSRTFLLLWGILGIDSVS